ncbi:T9SS type A sorting domain-containing protein [bacterium]|nr:T9SS type A sorting domain-containing protein [bacterium]MBU1982821.1 T9SS type A sorting domain-containing protein [bacterium]
MEQGLNASELTYHLSFPNREDPWYLADSTDQLGRQQYYGVDNIPRIDIDGRRFWFGSLPDPQVLGDTIAARQTVPSRVWMALEGWVNIGGDSVFIEVKVAADSALGPGVRLHMAVAEIYTHWDEPAPNGQQDFYGALLRMYPNAAGQEFTHSGNVLDTLTFRAALAVPWQTPVPWQFDNLKCMAWVQSSGSRDVLQSISRVLCPLVLPQPGDTLYVGLPTVVEWMTHAFAGNVRLELNRNYPDGPWETILDNLTNTGVAEWTVTGPTSTHARFRLSTFGDPSQCDTAAGDIFILNPTSILVTLMPIYAELDVGDTLLVTTTVVNTGLLDARVTVIANAEWAQPLESSFVVPVGTDYELPIFFDARGFTGDTLVADIWMLTGNFLSQEVMVILSVTLSDTRTPLAPLSPGLSEAYPNPFNATTRITLTLDKAAPVKMAVYSITGREVASVLDGMLNAGVHQPMIDASGWASGTYFLRVDAGEHVYLRKLLLMR